MTKKKNNNKEAQEPKINTREIVVEMKTSYIDYAMSVIVSRALPDVRDGMKPVHRRILYAMYGMGLSPGGGFRKSAAVTGEVLGKYHPHGDVAVYDTIARMAQDFSLRYPLVIGQGNWGSIDGDPPAAARYTECKLSKIGEELLRDIEKDTVGFMDNYDGTRQEPSVLPAPVPQLLLNGAVGIAVGMATNIPTHNLTEVCEAAIHLLNHPRATTEDLFEFMQGPDFPTGGAIYGKKDIVSAYSQGKGAVINRGKAEIIEGKKKNDQVIITEIPYQVQKAKLVQQIAKLVQDKKVDGVKDVRDESDKEGLRIAIDLQRGAYPKKVLNRLYKFTDLQKSFYLNMIALVDGIQPRLLSLVDFLSFFLDHRKQVIYRRTKFDLEKSKAREHILEGLHKCLNKIDDVIKTIKSSENRNDAQKKIMKKFKLSEIQANAILDTKLSSLAKLERKNIEEELKEIRAKIKELTVILNSPQKIKKVVEKELEEVKEKYGDERRTKVYVQKLGEIAEEDLIPQEETIITLTKGGYIKRVSPSIFKTQKRGGKGILGMKTMQDDIVEHFLLAQTHDSMLFFTDSGKVFRTLAYEIPKGTRVSRGRGLLNFLELSSGERVLSLQPLGKEDSDYGFKNLVMITENGIIKKTPLGAFENIRRSGLIALKLRRNDFLRKTVKTTGKDDLVIVTRKGKSIRIREKDVRTMGRTAAGLIAIRMSKEDKVVSVDVIRKGEEKPQYLLVITEKGYGKKTEIKEYRIQGRGGGGIKTANITSKTGDIVASRVLREEEDLIVISAKGHVIRTKISSVPKLSRATQGVRIIRLAQGDKVVSTAFI